MVPIFRDRLYICTRTSVVCSVSLTLLELQSRFWDKTSLTLSIVSPKRDCGPERVNLSSKKCACLLAACCKEGLCREQGLIVNLPHTLRCSFFFRPSVRPFVRPFVPCCPCLDLHVCVHTQCPCRFFILGIETTTDRRYVGNKTTTQLAAGILLYIEMQYGEYGKQGDAI